MLTKKITSSAYPQIDVTGRRSEYLCAAIPNVAAGVLAVKNFSPLSHLSHIQFGVAMRSVCIENNTGRGTGNRTWLTGR
jgi:hypothetical protein